MSEKAGPILIGLAYLALVVFIMLFCAEQSKSYDEFAKYWGLFGTLVGVATGAIPSFFFKTQADNAQQSAEKEADRAAKEATKAQLFAAATEPAVARQIQADNAVLFE